MASSKFLFILLVLVAFITPSFSQSASQLFNQGLLKENGEGDLKAAIVIYEKIVGDATADRSLRAKAQLHIGICWDKMGKDEAQKAYKQVIQEFADQQEVVAKARARLSELDQPARIATLSGMVVRKVWEGSDIDDCGEISPDGKYLSYVHWDTGDLAVYEIATGKKRLLTNKGSWDESNEYALESRWSPDSKQLVYAWDRIDSVELRIISLERSEPRILYRSKKEVKWIEPRDWSQDNKYILSRCILKDNTNQIVLVSLKNGSLHTVKELGKSEFDTNLCFSPDGQYVVYDCPQKESINHDIYLISIDSSYETSLVKHPAHDYILNWSEDGKHLLFVSDRTGTPDIWSIEVLNKKAHGTPRLIKSNEGSRLPIGLGFTTNGSFYYCQYSNRTDVLITEIDPETGTIVVPPHEAINRFVGSNGTPDYSPDGKFLAYVSRRSPVTWSTGTRPTGNVLCIRSLDSGEDREFRPGLNNFGFPRWSPDSRSIMVVNWEDDNDRMGHYNIDVRTGDAKLEIMTAKPQFIHNHEWSTDGKSVYLVRSEPVGDSVRVFKIIVRDIENDRETELLSGTRDEIYSISRSPDGKWLAVLGLGKKMNLRVMPTKGGEPRVIHTFEQEGYRSIFHVWSADGKYIYLPKYCQTRADKKWDLWRIPLEGGDGQKLDIELNLVWWLSVHPDGRHIAFSTQDSNYKLPAIWVMENFISE